MPKLITPTVLAVNMLAALWLAVCYLPQRDRDVREAERSDQRAAALEDRAHVVDSLTALRAEADSQAAVRVRALEGTAARARSVMRSESVRGDSLDALLAVHLAADSLPDTLVVLIRSTLAARDSGLAACRVGWSACDSTMAELVAAGLRRDSTVLDLRGLLASTDSTLTIERRRARPGWLETARRSLPWMAAASLVTLVLVAR